MKRLMLSALLLCGLASLGNAQCMDIVIPDSSFEISTFEAGAFPHEDFYWYRDDGCQISGGDSFHGDSSACSNGGGAFMFIPVDSNTTYYISARAKNGSLNYPPTLFVPGGNISVPVSGTEWTFVSASFNSGPSTSVRIGFYSMGACFDFFRVTCDPVVAAQPIVEEQFFEIFPTVSSSNFTLDATRAGTLEVMDMLGQIVLEESLPAGRHHFGQELPAGAYVARMRSGDAVSSLKILKTGF